MDSTIKEIMLFLILSAVASLITITYHLSNTIDGLELSKIRT